MNSTLRSLTLAAGLLAAALTVAACAAPTPSPTPTATPTPVPTPTPPFGLPPLTLPADESPHDFTVEWWYFNAHLEADGGGRYALHDVVFQVRPVETARTMYVRQIGLVDAGANVHAAAERLRLADAPLDAAPGDFSIPFAEGLMSGAGGREYVLRAEADGYAYDLRLISAAPPMLHGGVGLLDFREAGVTYYYTRPRLDIEGTLVAPGGDALRVTGVGWLDKQWGDFQPIAVEWDWASVQLDDGTDFMASVLYDGEGRLVEKYATLRLPGGEARRLEADEFTLASGEAEWRSPRTGTAYRVDWRVEIPGEGLSLRLRPLAAESEFVGALLPVAYWESGVDALDASGARVGQGFVELNWPRGSDR